MRIFLSRKRGHLAMVILLLIQTVLGYPQDSTYSVGIVQVDKKQKKPIHIKSDGKPYVVSIPLQKNLKTYELQEDKLQPKNSEDDVKYKNSGRARRTIEDTVKEIIAKQAGLKLREIKNDATLRSLSLDSLDDVELSRTLEAKFDCKIPDEELDKIKTVQDVVNTVRKIFVF